MQVGTLCQRLVFTVSQCDEISRAARVMREKHVGYLVVVESDPVSGNGRPIGVLSDRDIVVSVVAREVDPKTVRVGDIMTPYPVMAVEWESMEAALQKMRQFGVRRLPVVNGYRELVGVLAVDDVLNVLASDAQDVASTIRNERQMEAAARP